MTNEVEIAKSMLKLGYHSKGCNTCPASNYMYCEDCSKQGNGYCGSTAPIRKKVRKFLKKLIETNAGLLNETKPE